MKNERGQGLYTRRQINAALFGGLAALASRAAFGQDQITTTFLPIVVAEKPKTIDELIAQESQNVTDAANALNIYTREGTRYFFEDGYDKEDILRLLKGTSASYTRINNLCAELGFSPPQRIDDTTQYRYELGVANTASTYWERQFDASGNPVRSNVTTTFHPVQEQGGSSESTRPVSIAANEALHYFEAPSAFPRWGAIYDPWVAEAHSNIMSIDAVNRLVAQGAATQQELAAEIEMLVNGRTKHGYGTNTPVSKGYVTSLSSYNTSDNGFNGNIQEYYGALLARDVLNSLGLADAPREVLRDIFTHSSLFSQRMDQLRQAGHIVTGALPGGDHIGIYTTYDSSGIIKASLYNARFYLNAQNQATIDPLTISIPQVRIINDSGASHTIPYSDIQHTAQGLNGFVEMPVPAGIMHGNVAVQFVYNAHIEDPVKTITVSLGL